MNNIGHWTLLCDWDEEALGFLYKITEQATGKFYIGIKQTKTTRMLPPLKNKKRKRKKIADSDWRNYCGSGTISDIVAANPDRFTKEIISFHHSKRELQYAECKYLVTNDCLFDGQCWNEMLNYRLRFHKNLKKQNELHKTI